MKELHGKQAWAYVLFDFLTELAGVAIFATLLIDVNGVIWRTIQIVLLVVFLSGPVGRLIVTRGKPVRLDGSRRRNR